MKKKITISSTDANTNFGVNTPKQESPIMTWKPDPSPEPDWIYVYEVGPLTAELKDKNKADIAGTFRVEIKTHDYKTRRYVSFMHVPTATLPTRKYNPTPPLEFSESEHLNILLKCPHLIDITLSSVHLIVYFKKRR